VLLVFGLLLLAGGGLGAAKAIASIVRHGGRGSTFVANAQMLAAFAFATIAAWGALTVAFRRRRGMMEANAFAAFCALLTPVLAEVALRAGIALEIPALRRPHLYANPYSDDDFFKLVRLWKWKLETTDDSPVGISAIAPHPLLGWAYPETSDNPLGALTDAPYRIDPAQPTIFFYGDSFVARGEPMADKLPQQLGRVLGTGVRVFNLGVSGYGLDQIFLRFRESHGAVPGASIVVGVMTEDIDRCVLTYRNHPKPWFEVQENALVLRCVPVPSSSVVFLEQQPLALRSFFAAAVRRAAAYLSVGASFDVETRRDEKEQIASLLLGEFARIAREEQLDLRFVVFSPSGGGGWRREFLTRELQRNGLPFVDAEGVLRASMGEGGRFEDFFDASGHLEARANAILAEAIARDWTRARREARVAAGP
jgi:hypothetical protein